MAVISYINACLEKQNTDNSLIRHFVTEVSEVASLCSNLRVAEATLGAREFLRVVSGYGEVFVSVVIVRGIGLRPKKCSRRAREKTSGTQGKWRHIIMQTLIEDLENSDRPLCILNLRFIYRYSL